MSSRLVLGVSILALTLASASGALANPKNKFSEHGQAYVNAHAKAHNDAIIESYNKEIEVLSTQQLEAHFSSGTINFEAAAAAAAADAAKFDHKRPKKHDKFGHKDRPKDKQVAKAEFKDDRKRDRREFKHRDDGKGHGGVNAAAAAAAGKLINGDISLAGQQNFAGIANQNFVTAQFNNSNVGTSIAALATLLQSGQVDPRSAGKVPNLQ